MLSYGGRPVALLGKGDYLTREAFLPPMKILPIGQLVVEDSGASSPGLGPSDLLRRLGRHAARLSQSALSRTADFFLELAEKFANEGQETLEIDLPLSQSQLAQLLGMSVVHMNRTMMQLKAGNYVRYGKGILIIPDRQRLADLGEAAPE